MKLSDAQKEMLRNCLIAQCANAGTIGLPLATLTMGAHSAGFARLDEDDLFEHLEYLVIQELLSVQGAAVSARLKRWLITKAGMTHAEAKGLV